MLRFGIKDGRFRQGQARRTAETEKRPALPAQSTEGPPTGRISPGNVLGDDRGFEDAEPITVPTTMAVAVKGTQSAEKTGETKLQVCLMRASVDVLVRPRK